MNVQHLNQEKHDNNQVRKDFFINALTEGS